MSAKEVASDLSAIFQEPGQNEQLSLRDRGVYVPYTGDLPRNGSVPVRFRPPQEIVNLPKI